MVKTNSTCKGFFKSASLIEGAVIEQIRQTALSNRIQKVLLQDIRKRNSKKNVPSIKERDKLLLEMESMGEKFSQWADRLDAGKIDEDQFERQNAKLLSRKKIIQDKLSAIDAELAHEENLEVTLTEVQSALKDFPRVWQALELEERREVLRMLIEELKVNKTYAELKLLFLKPVTISLDANRSKVVAGNS